MQLRAAAEPVLGSGDCEQIHGGLLAQPSNTWSSLAFVLVGAWIITRGWDRPDRRFQMTMYGLTVAFAGIGSVLFHGPQWGGSHWAHDFSIMAVLAFILSFDVASLRDLRRPAQMLLFACVLVISGVLLAVFPAATNLLTGILVATVLSAEFFVWYAARVRRHDLSLSAENVGYWVLAGVLVLAGVANILGRTGSPVCDPDGILQGHALWHLLGALAMGVFSWAALEKRRMPGALSPTESSTTGV